MYLAIEDNEIKQNQNYVKLINKKILQDFNALPFWKKWFERDNVKQEIIRNWKNFEIWRNRRMAKEITRGMSGFRKAILKNANQQFL